MTAVPPNALTLTPLVFNAAVASSSLVTGAKAAALAAILIIKDTPKPGPPNASSPQMELSPGWWMRPAYGEQ
ncbi:MAG: hypothetical protein M5U34_16065 [Chloroflexi bacterium]|nr:hypothetical protein [Chloroflexota bacterium]